VLVFDEAGFCVAVAARAFAASRISRINHALFGA
jgi:hypothetical protein